MKRISISTLMSVMLAVFALDACAPATPAEPPQLITVYSSAAAEPWLVDLYECAAGTPAALSRLPEQHAAQIVLRLGEPEALASPAFEVGVEEILIVTQAGSPVGDLDLPAARAFFAGQGDPSVQVWAYAPGSDVQQAFDRAVLSGRGVAASARLAADPRHMAEMLSAGPDALGILPRSWLAGDARAVFSAASVPVLAITRDEPEGVIEALIACLQSD